MTIAVSRVQPQTGFVELFSMAVPAVLFGLRLAAAVSLALLVAFYLELDTPSWAGTSAAIVCQPIVGSSLLKGAFRMVGTVAGAVAAVVLTAAFPQDRAGFLLGLLLWASACSFVATLLRNFAAYAAMLAGYTLIIIASTSIDTPDRVFELAIERASEICVGIVCGTLVVALTDLGSSPRRLSALLSQLVVDTAGHLVSVLAKAGARDAEGPAIRRALLRRTAALDPVIDAAAGEAPEVLQRRATLHAAMNGLFEALSGARIVETHLRSLPAASASQSAVFVLDRLPAGWRGATPDDPTIPSMALDRGTCSSAVRRLVGVRTGDLSLRITADGAADTAAGLAAAANGLLLLNDPARAHDLPSASGFFVADYLPAVVNALRVFIGVGVVVLFWIITEWPSGLLAVTFAAVTIMVFSPMEARSGNAALGQAIGTVIAIVVAAIVKFAVLPAYGTFLAFSLVIAAALVPLGAAATVPVLAPFFMSATINFMPLFAPTNQMIYDAPTYFNTAFGVLCGCVAGGLALVLIPHVPVRIRSQRLVDLSIRDLRRLAAGRRNWTLSRWQSRIFARMAALPDEAEPVQRSYLVATLTVGQQVIRLQRLSRRGRAGAEISEVQASLAAGDLPRLRASLDAIDKEIASIPDTEPGARGRLRARAALRIIAEAINRQSEYFEGHPA